MKYEEARALIKTGDLIAIKGNSLLNLITRFFTHGPHTHTGNAIWFGDRLCMVELNGGRNHYIPISQLAKKKFDVYETPEGLTEAAIRNAIFNMTADPIDYSETAFLVIGLISWLKLKVKLSCKDLLVCAGFSVAVYEEAGWKEAPSRMISPTALTKLLKYKFSVEP